jgi:hypothetical protein
VATPRTAHQTAGLHKSLKLLARFGLRRKSMALIAAPAPDTLFITGCVLYKPCIRQCQGKNNMICEKERKLQKGR